MDSINLFSLLDQSESSKSILRAQKSLKSSKASFSYVSEVPDFVGMSRIEAINTLIQNGINYLIYYTSSNATLLNNDTVQSQSSDNIVYLYIYQYNQSLATITFANDPFDSPDQILTGDFPVNMNLAIGSTIIIPGKGNLEKSDLILVPASTPPPPPDPNTPPTVIIIGPGGGSFIQQRQPLNFIGWSDDERLYYPGQEYIVNQSNIVLTGYWSEQFAASQLVFSAQTAPQGDTVTVTGKGLASTVYIQVANLSAPFTIIDHDKITFTVPGNNLAGRVLIRSARGASTLSRFIWRN